ncbi:MAG: hypothetical protein IKU86_08055 [Thermoguttaceae bacterium]|nr:hypothetical protein [Thermoguttaceae bacterium]
MSREARLLFRDVAKKLSPRRSRGFSRICRLNGTRNDRVSVFRNCLTAALVATFLFGATSAVEAATWRTANFVVHADSADFARKAGDAAERYRQDLAIAWLGRPLPRWSNPCVVTIKTSPTLGAGGETVFTFCDGEVFDWKMTAQGTEERVLDSVLPHEITHTILASYLRAPAPRWIDEGMATSVEADSERTNYRLMLADFLHGRKGIAFNDMVAMAEYPSDLMPFYSQSFSVCEYLILIGGRRRLVEFAKEGVRSNDWNAALRRFYEGRSLGDLQLEWVAWVGEWDAANRPTSLPATPKLRDFDEWRREEMLASRTPNLDSVEPTARAQIKANEDVASPWKTTLGAAFDGVRRWGSGSEKKRTGENGAIRGRTILAEPTAAIAFEEKNRVSTDALDARNKQNGQGLQVDRTLRDAQNGSTSANVGERRATIWIPRASQVVDSERRAANLGALRNGAGSASRASLF